MSKFVVIYTTSITSILSPYPEKSESTQPHHKICDSLEEAEEQVKAVLKRVEGTYTTREGISATIYPLRDGVTYKPSLTKTYSFKEDTGDDA